ncbi:MAG: hypothetical protein MHMPM18_003721, partial [Marteilia pararefringens]
MDSSSPIDASSSAKPNLPNRDWSRLDNAEPKSVSDHSFTSKSPSTDKSGEAPKTGSKRMTTASLFELGETQKQQIKQAFEIFSEDSNGTIKKRDLKVIMRGLGYDMSENDISKLMKQYDTKRTGLIDFSDFLKIITQKIAESDPYEELEKAFAMFDKNGNGRIGFDDIKAV